MTVLERCQDQWHWNYLLAAQFRWTSHVIHMEEHRIPKQIFYGLLTWVSRFCGGQFKRYKDTLKVKLKMCGIPFAELESRSSDRTAWPTTCRVAIEKFALNRTDQLKEKRQRRKRQPTATADGFIYDICRRTCGSRIDMLAHRRVHRW